MKSKAKKAKDVEQYTHKGSKRSNNPPVGLVTLETDPDHPKKRYSHDPRLDPQLMWSSKQENTEFDVDTVSLHVHERIDPHTIIEKAMKLKEHAQSTLHSFFDSTENKPPLRDAIEFYKHDQDWSNRLIAGDSLIVMNSLLEKEGMEGKVQMIYIDPPYGIKYGSNFQPFVNKRSVKDGKDEDLTQEPEMIKAFRDTWELGIHSYLQYLRDRLILAKHLLTESGSCIVQISLENVSRIRIIMDEIFGADNFVNMITVQKTTSSTSKTLDSVADYLLWYAKDVKNIKYHDLFIKKVQPVDDSGYKFLELKGKRRPMTKEERTNPLIIPKKAKIFGYDNLTSKSGDGSIKFEFENETFTPGNGSWKTSLGGLQTLVAKNRISKYGTGLGYVRYFNDFPYRHFDNIWVDAISSFLKKMYVVQSNSKIVERILLMTTDPGDRVLDPTCGSGTTAYVAEKWGRQWMTCDTSRVALVLTKQRLMTASFDYFRLLKPDEGVSSGFEYKTVPHITLGSLANNETPTIETLYDKPIVDKTKTRVTGPFTVEAVPAPTVKSIDELSKEASNESKNNKELGRSLQQQWRDELLKTGIRGKSGQKIEFSGVETHPATRWLHADAETKGENPKRVMISFGPEHAPLEQRQVELAIEEARDQAQKPSMIIFAAMQFDPEAAKDIDELNWPGITILKAEMNKDLLTKDLKKKRSTNESFWLMGQPDVELEKNKDEKYTVSVNGFDYYNIANDEIESGGSSKIAMWMLDTDYDGRSIYPQQVFFPMENNLGWEKLAKTLHAQIDEELIAKYKGTKSIPFESGPNRRAAIKIVDDRGIESLKILDLE